MARPRFYAFTDVGNAERICTRYIGEFRFVPAWDAFIVWDKDGRWSKDPAGVGMQRFAKETLRSMLKSSKPDPADSDSVREYKKSLRKWSLRCSDAARIAAMTRLTRDEPGVSIDHEKLDAKSWLFNVRNGTIDLRKGTLQPHRSSDLLTKQAWVRFDPSAKCPRWEAFLEKVMPDAETRKFLQRFVGYCMTAEVTERMFLVIHGPRGRNGKTLFLRVLQALFGPYATTAAPGLLMARKGDAHPAEVADLCGVRLSVASETRKGRVFDEEQVKRLTGNDPVKARLMRENFWTFLPTHKLVIVANHRPRVKDASDSFWDRIVLIPFLTRISESEEDKNLLEKLTRELSGILNWALAGCLEWQKVGLEKPRLAVESTLTYRDDEDQVAQFIADRLVFEPDGRTSNPDLARAATSWSEQNDVPPIHASDLRDRLREAGCRPNKSNGVRLWEGVTLRKPQKSREK